ncbi:MAG TPA: shikimate kinase [Saprospiraceae bacterium]|nr:shikimate kinase [Saprospiraceae bacterium]
MTNLVHKKHIFLIGLPYSGKSLVGRLLADAIGLNHYDSDLWMERFIDQSAAQFLQQNGEKSFRMVERFVLMDLLCKPPSVVSVGGGLACFFDHIHLMNQHLTVYLKVEPAIIHDRFLKNPHSRPLFRIFSRSDFEQLLAKRDSIYSRSHIVILAERRPEIIVQEVLDAIKQ